MPETTVICLDNSEWARNADYRGTRLQAQQETINVICNISSQANSENCLGVVAMAGSGGNIRVTPTNDMKLIQNSIHGLKIEGTADILKAVSISQLALKYRTNKTQKQRILCFVGSPITTPVEQLETLGKQLKKNNVALDIISFGNISENSEKLKRLHTAVDSNETSHYLECPSECGGLLSDMVVKSGVMRGSEGAAAQANPLGGDTSGVNEFGVDPNLDPDLYLALRISMDEEQARSQRENATKAASDVPPQVSPEDLNDAEADEELRQALMLSLQDYAGEREPASDAQPAETAFLAELEGVDPSDPDLQAALRAATESKNNTETKKDDSKK